MVIVILVSFLGSGTPSELWMNEFVWFCDDCCGVPPQFPSVTWMNILFWFSPIKKDNSESMPQLQIFMGYLSTLLKLYPGWTFFLFLVLSLPSVIPKTIPQQCHYIKDWEVWSWWLCIPNPWPSKTEEIRGENSKIKYYHWITDSLPSLAEGET